MMFFPVQVPVWDAPIAPLLLQPDELHIWCASLQVSDDQLAALDGTLSLDERERVQRLRFERHWRRAIASRGILRAILSQYVQQPAAHLHFSYGSYGKPALSSAPTLQFNVSHSEDLALYAIGRDTLIGIDLEAQREVSQLDHLMQRYFSAQECLAIAAHPPHYQQDSFFYYWTAKEALTKATGQGIADLTKTELHLKDQQIYCLYDHPLVKGYWQIALFQPQVKFAAAVVYDALHPRSLRFWQWQMN